MCTISVRVRTVGVEELTECGVYSYSHIRLGRTSLRKWRRLRSEAKRDLPKLAAVARLLEQVVVTSEGSNRDEAKELLGALRRRIEESKMRFSIE